MAAGMLGLIVSALFTGAGLYITLAEQPARLGLADGPLLAQWKPSYQRGFMMQASLAALGAFLGVVAFMLSRDTRWLLGAAVLFANWPFTMIVIMPTNRRLFATGPGAAGPQSRALIERWGRLHAVRVALGAFATLIFYDAALRLLILGGGR